MTVELDVASAAGGGHLLAKCVEQFVISPTFT